MNTTYRNTIAHLIEMSAFEIEPDVQITGRAPTMASSMFLTNKEVTKAVRYAERTGKTPHWIDAFFERLKIPVDS